MSKISKKTIAKNSGFLYIRMLITMLIGLYTSRIILQYLGEISFGVYGVVWSLVSLFSFFNLSMTTASNRCLSYELGESVKGRYAQVFGTLVRYSIIAGIFILLFQVLVGSYFIENKLNIPFDKTVEAVKSYYVLCAVFFISVLQIPFTSSLISQEKIKVYSYISIADSVLKLLLALVLSFYTNELLLLYSYLLLIQHSLIFFLFLYFSLKKTKISFRRDQAINKEVNRYLIWNVLGGISSIGLNQGIQLLLNVFFSPIVNAAQTIANQVKGTIEQFTSNIRISFNPPIIKSCAQRNINETLELLSFSVRFSSIAVILVSTPIIVKLDYILKLWLVNPPAHTTILTLLLILNSIIDNVTTPIVSVIQARGDIKKYQIISSLILLSILPASYFLYLKGIAPEAYGVLLLVASVLMLIVRIVFLHQILTVNPIQIIKLILMQAFVFPLFSLIVPLILSYILTDTLYSLILITIVSILIVMTISWTMIVKPRERKILRDYFNRRIKKA